MSFNSHPHKEDDALVTSGIACATPFNSHPHKEDDLSVLLIYLLLLPFNSHPHKEDDCITLYFLAVKCLSTHILTRRMTPVGSMRYPLIFFQLTSSQGGWPGDAISSIIGEIFQLTSSQGGWLLGQQAPEAEGTFNSHPHKEDDSNFKQKHSV